MELACVNIRGTNGNSDYCEFVPIIRGHTYTRNNDLQQKLDNNQGISLSSWKGLVYASSWAIQ